MRGGLRGAGVEQGGLPGGNHVQLCIFSLRSSASVRLSSTLCDAVFFRFSRRLKYNFVPLACRKFLFLAFRVSFLPPLASSLSLSMPASLILILLMLFLLLSWTKNWTESERPLPVQPRDEDMGANAD